MSPEGWNLLVLAATVWCALVTLVVGFLAAAAHGDRRSMPLAVSNPREATSAEGRAGARFAEHPGLVTGGGVGESAPD